MTFEVKAFGDLNTYELYEILRLRAAIFVVEQDCAYQDVDGKDQIALHVMGRDGNELVAYARIFAPGDYFVETSIGRVAVVKQARKKGLGRVIMKASMEAAEERFADQPIALSAQTYLRSFYRDLGFHEVGEEYLEDGIPHIRMLRNNKAAL